MATATAADDDALIGPATLTDEPGTAGVFSVKLAGGADCRRSSGSGPNGVAGHSYWAGWCSGCPLVRMSGHPGLPWQSHPVPPKAQATMSGNSSFQKAPPCEPARSVMTTSAPASRSAFAHRLALARKNGSPVPATR
jgi:hypothetical protein